MPKELIDLPAIATRPQLSEFTQVSIPTLARWAMNGEGPKMTKIGRAARYRRQDVLDWLDSL